MTWFVTLSLGSLFILFFESVFVKRTDDHIAWIIPPNRHHHYNAWLQHQGIVNSSLWSNQPQQHQSDNNMSHSTISILINLELGKWDQMIALRLAIIYPSASSCSPWWWVWRLWCHILIFLYLFTLPGFWVLGPSHSVRAHVMARRPLRSPSVIV